MIYTVTFNPAIDYVVHMDELRLGYVNRSANEAVFYGGKGINVSTVLNNLGIPSVALGFVAGFTGEEIEKGIQVAGIVTDFIHLKKGMSRINIKIKADKETEINGRGPEISDDEIEQLYLKLDRISDGDVLVLAGAIPGTMPADIYERIMKRLKDKNIDIIVDATNDLLMNVLKYHPFLIKPNNHELGEIFGKELKTDDDIIFYAKKMQEMGAKNVLVSMGGAGAILIAETGECYKIGVPVGKVVNSTGAGDSMVAGFVASYFTNHDYPEALKYGTAAGSATTFSQGLADVTLVDELYNNMIPEPARCTLHT